MCGNEAAGLDVVAREEEKGGRGEAGQTSFSGRRGSGVGGKLNNDTSRKPCGNPGILNPVVKEAFECKAERLHQTYWFVVMAISGTASDWST